MPMRRDQYYRSVRERTPLLRRITEEPGAVIRGSISSALEGLRHDEEQPISKTRGGFIIASIGLLIFLQGTVPFDSLSMLPDFDNARMCRCLSLRSMIAI
jgi:hypothetical protein